MKVISKRISRNEFISRKNGVIPWLLNEWSVPCGYGDYSFDTYSSAVQKANELGLSSSLLEYKGKFTYNKDYNNYGFIVSDIILPQDIANLITDYTDFYVNIPDGNGGYFDLSNPTSSAHPHYERDENGKLTRKIVSGGTEVKILTYATLNKWYTFFKEYYEKIKPFNRSIDYYNDRYENKNDENEKKFTDLDALFDSRGGEYMFDWLNGYCFPNDGIGYLLKSYSNTSRTFTAFTEYADYFSINDLLVLYNKTTGKKYELKIDSFTKTSDNGGKIICSLVIKEGEEVEDIVLSTGDEIELYSNEFECSTNSASYVIPILLTNSIDDLGEMAIFSSKWQAGVDYHNRVESSNCDRNFKNSYRPQLETFVDCNGNTDDQCFGTIVDRPYYYDNQTDKNIVSDNETYMIKSGNDKKGYVNDGELYENVFSQDDWVNYTDWYICNNRREFASYDVNSVVSRYAYSPVDGRVIYNPSSTDDEIIPYTKKDFILVNGELIQVIDGAYVTPNYPQGYVIQKQNTKLPVIKDGAVMYAELNGKRFYGVKDSGNYKIYFFDKCIDTGSTITSGISYVLYNNSLFLCSGGSVEINDGTSAETKTYSILNGYFTYNGATYFISGNSVIGMDNAVVNNNGTVTIKHVLDIKTADIITGYTESKLELLRRTKVNTDELGNDLPGYIDFPLVISAGTEASAETSHYNTAYDSCELDLLYKVGQFSDIEYQKTVGDINYFNGNYLESIIFYHVDENGNKIESSITSVNINDEPKNVARRYFEGGDKYEPGTTVYCDITYYIGATLENIVEKNSDGVITKNEYALINGRHKGVKYVDTLIVNRTVGTFYMSDKSTFGFTYYELLGNMSSEYLCDYRDFRLTNISYFEMQIMTFFNNNRSDEEKLFKTDYWERNNGMIVSPVLRPEYYLFTSTKQNGNDDIYIDRGISAAFERHLKLLETHNMDALENYGNGYFKISEY